jgi:hypothetical protein
MGISPPAVRLSPAREQATTSSSPSVRAGAASRAAFVFTIRGGKLVEWRILMNEEQALDAVGVRD